MFRIVASAFKHWGISLPWSSTVFVSLWSSYESLCLAAHGIFKHRGGRGKRTAASLKGSPWFVHWVPGQPGLYSLISPQNKQSLLPWSSQIKIISVFLILISWSSFIWSDLLEILSSWAETGIPVKTQLPGPVVPSEYFAGRPGPSATWAVISLSHRWWFIDMSMSEEFKV